MSRLFRALYSGFFFLAAQAMMIGVPIAQAYVQASSLTRHELQMAPQDSNQCAALGRIARVRRPKQPPLLPPTIFSSWPFDASCRDLPANVPSALALSRAGCPDHPPA